MPEGRGIRRRVILVKKKGKGLPGAERGSVLVEFMIILPVILAMVLFFFNVTAAYFVKHTMGSVATEAVRYAAVSGSFSGADISGRLSALGLGNNACRVEEQSVSSSSVKLTIACDQKVGFPGLAKLIDPSKKTFSDTVTMKVTRYAARET